LEGIKTIDNNRDYRKSMKIALFITVNFIFVEIAGGLLSGSLALISDAGHMFSDLLVLILSLGAMTLALQLPTKERTYGITGQRSLQQSSTPCCNRSECRYHVGGISACS